MSPDEENETFTPKEENAVVENEQQQTNDQVADTGTETVEATPEPEAEKPAKKPIDPLQRRIDELTKKRHEADRRAAELEERLKQYEKPDEKQTQAADLDALAEKKAEELVARREYTKRVNAWAKAGETEFKDDFNSKCNVVANLGAAERPEFMQIITDPDLIENGHKVVVALADDPEEAERILSLPPVAMSAALVKYADKLSKPKAKPTTKAPDPIKPITGTAKASDDPNDSDSDEEWMRKRNAQIAARNGGGARF